MKIRIEINEKIEENEVIIRCRNLDEQVMAVQSILTEKLADEKLTATHGIIFYKDNDEYYFPLADVLFFATESEMVYAHTDTDVFRTDYRLYELERLLPSEFIRVAKSAIVNVKQILSISKNLTSVSLLKFHKSHKQLYVSRHYYKGLKEKLKNRDF
ncbi:MAG: LytTR family transcriptional regulator [Lachnospiraceae bacterium]|nr:LytTR family transcriptional regulator [Lachnospiraceae bacterium]